LCQTKKEPEACEQKRLLKRKQDGKTPIECPASYEDVKVSDLLDGIQTNQLPNWSKEENMKKIFIPYSKLYKRYKIPLIQKRCERGECKLVPIIVSACHWTRLDFANKNALPNKGVAVRGRIWQNHDEAWTTVIQQLEKII
jgi:hypothetical protein